MTTVPNLKHNCKFCFKDHPLEYRIQSNSTQHLVYKCTARKQTRVVYLSFIPNLDIPSFKTSKALKKELQEAQLGLFKMDT